MSIAPARPSASTSASLFTSNCTGVTRSDFNASRSSRLRAPAMTSPAPASTNAVTSARPSPRLAPVISTRLPSICMHVHFRRVVFALHPRELIKTRADNAPNQQQFNTRQRLPTDALRQRQRAQRHRVLTQLDQNHQTHREYGDNRSHLLHTLRQVNLDLTRQARIQPREKQKY